MYVGVWVRGVGGDWSLYMLGGHDMCVCVREKECVCVREREKESACV